MVRAAKVAPAFQFYPTSYPSDDEDPPAPSVARHKHIWFNNDGQVSEHHSYLASAVSPAKPNPFPEPDATQWNSEHIPDIISHPYIDPAYQHELDLMNPDLPKRKRTKAKWNGVFFDHLTLRSLGLRVQLGHGIGDSCSNPVPSHDDTFTVIDVKGIHQIHLDYCTCQTAQALHVQLLHPSWYPSTTSNPCTAATFHVLEHFHLLTFKAKSSGFALYNTLARSTDNTGTAPPPDRYPSFMQMIREWRHIKLLKRAGRAHKLEGPGPESAQQGDCAVICPACPHPGRNIPDDWAADKDKLWLYALFLAIDANFRLKRKDISSDTSDPSLNRGRTYFVEEVRYKAHLANYGDQEETSGDCVNHDAVKSANKVTVGLAATGAGTVDCARHNMKRPHAVGDLQASERQCNIDYLFLSSILGCMLLWMNILYDICCQWSVHLIPRMAAFPEEFHVDLSRVKWTYLVPKFHLPAHIERCQTVFSFNFTRFVGRTDGEAPEHGWSDINAVATSTQEMGPGSPMPPTFVRKIKDTVPERAQHVDDFEELTENLPPESVAAWTVAVEAWEADRRQVNPFVSIAEIVTECDIKLELAREESAELASGTSG
ncbi:hypothetical protein HWV62_37241 [Athelia sp. TMB]|nr:hypothetical protein HWV62_37241 [Athelia sp. TMB]